MMEKATFGAGCFWGAEATFRRTPGVVATAVGFMHGGRSEVPAEVVEVEFDPKLISYSALLDVFWGAHDPTSLNRQGEDVGEEYRSVIFGHSAQQVMVARESREVLGRAGRYEQPIVTEILPVATFERAEEYHQRYLEKRGLASCAVTVGG